MYFKLSFCNLKRSAYDYLLYIMTMIILVSVLCVSNFIAIYGNIHAGFQTLALPLLIIVIMILLVDYINLFMMKQRAREFANYLLLGMDKHKLAYMFLIEFCCIGGLCFIFGELIGTGVCLTVFTSDQQNFKNLSGFIVTNIYQTFFFFIVVELLSAVRMKQKIYKLQIYDLMNEKRRNQPLEMEKKNYYGYVFIISISVLLLLLVGIVYLPDDFVFMIISIISVPLLCCIFAFYKWVYAYLSSKRLLQSDKLCQGMRIYHIAEITTTTKTSSIMSAIFCICFIFALTSFVFGIFMLNNKSEIYMEGSQRFMGFIQLSICIIFLTIYFSALSFQYIIEIRRQINNFRILYYMGKNQVQLRSLVKIHLMIKMLLPTLMCFLLLIIVIPFLNHKLNMDLSGVTNNLFMKAVGIFLTCFAILYLCYFWIAYRLSNRYIKASIKLS